MKTAMWKTLITRLQLYIVVWQDILKMVVKIGREVDTTATKA